jgi:ABC transporter with metal-binding/Fe-S-binding domain ATP-binding protein
MRVAALLSGGKDSVLAARLAEEEGHELLCLVTMRSANPDSYMFHTVNVEAAGLQAEAWGKRWVQAWTPGEKERELEDLKAALRGVPVEGVVSGAIASSYQRDRVEGVCGELGLAHVSPLWSRDREGLLRDVLGRGMRVIFTAVAAQGLDESWLGAELDEDAVRRLLRLNATYGVDPCGEGGEYETLVLDAPWFRKKIFVSRAEMNWDGVSGRYVIGEAHLGPKA